LWAELLVQLRRESDAGLVVMPGQVDPNTGMQIGGGVIALSPAGVQVLYDMADAYGSAPGDVEIVCEEDVN
jgi:hypothetical protein